MAGSKFQYDESGGTFFYFLLSFLALVVIPCTYYFWPKDSKKGETKRDRNQCHCEQCAIKASYLRSKEPWRKTKRRLIKILLILGWLALFACGYKVAHLQHDYINWDPYEILEIDPGASTAEIKKAYRRLSLIFHPDKETGDERKFLMIAKAHAALTDEEARKNWETYGNPDGPGAMSFGIALPSWIVEKENSILVLGLYALVFMIALPTAVGVWWYRSVKFGGDQVLLDTSQLYFYFIHKTPHMMLKRIMMIISASLEFERSHNSEVIERPSDNYEVPQLMKDLPNLGEKNKEKPLCFLYSIKARALLHAHLSRMKLPPNTLEIDKMYIVKKCPYLIQEFVQCVSQLIMLALAGRIARTPNLETIENAMKLSSLIVQALWDSKNCLMQLPHITDDILRHFTTRKRSVRNVVQLASMKDSDRRLMLRSLSDEQYEDVMNVISKMPLLNIDVRSEVLDDEDAGNITAGAIVTVTVTLTRQNMSVLFDQSNDNFDKITHNEQLQNEQEFDENQDTLVNTPNGTTVQNSSPQVKKPKVWEKNKGKGKKGGKNVKNKKKAQQTANKKKQQQQQQQQQQQTTNQNAVVPSSNDKSGGKSKKKDVSDGESDIDDKSNDESQLSESDNEDKNDRDKAKKSNKNSEDISDNEEDEEWQKFQQKVTKKDKVLETKSKQSHSVHCPYFPDDKQEYWWIYIADRKRHALITIPYLMTNLVEKEEVELKFTAPLKPGVYSYTVIVRSDSYVDFDINKTIKLDVKEAPKEIVSHPQWDISEEEEEANKDEDSAVEDSDLVASSEEESDSESEGA